jgi:hypothetical protein
VEFNALYRPFGCTQSFSTIAGLHLTRESANSWEFPLIAKYRFSGAIAHPFVGIGYDPRVVHGTDFSSGPVLLSLNPPVSQNLTAQTPASYYGTHGLVVSGGFELATGHFQISPEVRYVHWSQPFLNAQGWVGTFRIQSAQNEAFVLFGFMWRTKRR